MRANPNSSIAASVLGIANKAVSICLGAGNSFKTAEVIIPKVPSLPINSCFKSYPLLSFLKLVKLFHISPLAKTTSIPNTKSRAMPYLRTLIPPAFVDKFPPIVQDPSDARLKGNKKFFSSTIF